MPLINFRTDLTSLRYGADRPGGGSSNQPYMQFPIDNASTPSQIRAFYEINRTSLDFPVRGGAITQLLTGGTGIITSTIDRQRIEKFFNDAPRGTAFIEKQRGLQLTNPRMQVPNATAIGADSIANIGIVNSFIPVTNVYNPINTLAQVQVQGTGAHFNRHGVAPNLYENPRQTYAYIAGAPQNNTAATNRLSILRALKIVGNTNFLVNPDLIGGVGVDPTLVDRMGISPIQSQLFNYIGGPGSVYGIGNTRIFRYTDTNVTKLSQTNADPKFTVGDAKGVAYSAIALTYQQLATQGTDTRTPVQQPIQDFRAQTNENNPIIPFSNYEAFNITKTLGIGSPGAPNSRVSYISRGNRVGEDVLNMLFPFAVTGNQDPWATGGSQTKDIIKFAFECIDNTDPTQAIALVFRAFLEGSITDNNQASYNTFKYLGRGETFRTYQGFDRSIGFTFKMFAQSRQEMLPMYTKLNQLMSQVYPDYSPDYGIMRGNVVKLTIGDYIYRMPGFIENINITIDNSNTPWEIVLNQYLGQGVAENDVRELPHMVAIQCTFKPIMDILPRKVSKDNPWVPLIVNKDHYLDPAATTNDLKQTLATNSLPVAPAVGVQTPTQVDTQGQDADLLSQAEFFQSLTRRDIRRAARLERRQSRQQTNNGG
jgi:hypothetical protein